MEDWYFTLSSRVFGSEEFGPYDTKEEAQAGINRVFDAGVALKDDVVRRLSRPYQGSREDN